MDAQQLAMGMMFMDHMRMQHWNTMRLYENSYRNTIRTHPYQNPHNTHTNPVQVKLNKNIQLQTKPFKEEETVEFPIESYNVLKGRNDGVLSVVDGYLLCLEVEGFDWGYYSGRILKGLNTIEDHLITYIQPNSTLIPILKKAGFSEKYVEFDGVRWVRLEKK